MRSPIRTTPGRGSGGSFRRCTTSRCRRRRTAISTTWRPGPGISGDRFYKNAPGADFTTFTDAWVNANIRAQGAARQAVSGAVLHSRGGHAGVPRPDRQRSGECDEPDLRRLGRPLRVAAVLRRAARHRGRRAAIRIRARQLARHGRRRGRPAPTRPIRRRSGAGGRRSSTTSRRAWTGRSSRSPKRTTILRSS